MKPKVRFIASASTILLALSLVIVSTSSVDRPAKAATSVSYSFAWSQRLAVNADSAPVFAHNVKFPNGTTQNVLYVLAGNNTSDCANEPKFFVKASILYAFNANSGRLIWKRSTSGPSRCTTSAAVVKKPWVYAPGLDGKIHKYAAATGKEFKSNGWPVRYTLNPFREKESAALQISGLYLYATTGGFAGDLGHYDGHIVTINLGSGHVNVWNSLCSNIHTLLSPNPTSPAYCNEAGGALFGRGEAVTDPVNHDVYIATGNGLWDGKTNWGDSLLKLSPDGSRLLDSFTSTNQAYLDANDQDLGSTGPAMLPPVTVDRKIYSLMTQGGKGSAGTTKLPKALYLLNRDQMGSKPGPGSLGGSLQIIDAPGQKHVLSAPAVWTSPEGQVMVIYANNNDIQAYEVGTSGSVPQLKVAWDIHIDTPTTETRPGDITPYPNFTTPVISGNLLYVAHDGEIDVYNPEDGTELWSSKSLVSNGQTSENLHWEYPCVANGMIFMTDESGHVYAYRKTR